MKSNNDTQNSEEKKVPKYKFLGESGLVEDEDGNIFSASEIDTNYEEPVRKTEDKSDPEYWYYEYNPRYCGPSREAYMERMARAHARFAKDNKETTEKSSQSSTMQHFWQNSVQAVLEDKSNPAYWYYVYDPRYCGPSREAYMEKMAKMYRERNIPDASKISLLAFDPEEARERADREQKEAERRGLHPTFRKDFSYILGMNFTGIVDCYNNVVVSNRQYSLAGHYYCGFAMVQDRKTQKIGFVDAHGNEAIQCKWRSAGIFSEYLACVQDDSRKCGYIDTRGEVVIPCRWEEGWPFHEGVAKVQDNRKLGMIDHKGRIAVPCMWKKMSDCSEGLIGVMDDNDKCGFIDKTGKVVIPCQWRQVWVFKDGLAPVQDFNKRLGFIDKSGKIIIPCRWKKVNYFVNGRAKVSDSKKFPFRDKWVYIDKEGKIVK